MEKKCVRSSFVLMFMLVLMLMALVKTNLCLSIERILRKHTTLFSFKIDMFG